jgi:hypothetical protein
MRRAILSVAMSAMLILAASTAHAQQRQSNTGSNDTFHPGYMDVGPVIGVGGIGDASVSIGGRFEYGIQRLPDLGNGVLSFAASVDHYTYGGAGFSTTPIGATINYHFHLDNRQLDPFFGVGLGDYIQTVPANSPGSFNSGLYLIGRVGIRYFIIPNIALYADAGTGAGALHVGVMFKLK